MSSRKKKAGATGRSQRPKRSYLESRQLRVLLALVFLCIFVAACLFCLVLLREKYLPDYPGIVKEETIKESPSVEQTAPPVKSVADYRQAYTLLENDLLKGPQVEGWKKLPAEGRLVRLQMFGDFPKHARLAELSSRLSAMSQDASLDLFPRKGLVRFYWQQELRLELRYRVPLEVSSSRPKIAIIMDDMGRRISTFRELLELNLQVTPAILPESQNATKAALLLQQAGREYMIHIPMQPKNFPRVNPGPHALLLGQGEIKTRQLIRRYMAQVPGAAGGNNHMGSSYTEVREPMRIVLEELQQAGLYFVDSKTIATSVGFDEARKLGLPTAARQIFLDNEEEVSYIRAQIRKMVALSDAKGEVIAICHPYPETLQALRQELPWLQQQQIDFVAASALVKVY